MEVEYLRIRRAFHFKRFIKKPLGIGREIQNFAYLIFIYFEATLNVCKDEVLFCMKI